MAGLTMADRLQGKVALVSGAGSIGPGWGNGKAAAVLYAREAHRCFAAIWIWRRPNRPAI